MKVIAFNGSARKDGNTALLVGHVFEELAGVGIETELIQLAGQPIRGCAACGKCYENRDKRCGMHNDPVNEYIAGMLDADGIILASPTYFADITAELKALIDRAGMVAKSNGDMLRYKAGAAVVAVRRGGAIHAFDSINHFFTINQMIIPGASYWNMGIGRNVGEVESDHEGIGTMHTLGRNMAWLLERIAAGRS
ncbi:flavodoxin family protein [bacterium]|nr:flavodoxin family protein [candidate division CSSED10-310 bacterium]